MERCLDAGMIGVKLYNQFKYTNPVVFPIVERCIERRVPILGHSAYLTDAKALAAQPRTSNAADFCALSTRYPELMLILGHINGGGDWEWAIKALRECPHVYLDTSGSVQEDDTIGRCVRELGEERVLFATDLTMEGGVGKILSAELTAEQRERIFWGNFQKILDRRRVMILDINAYLGHYPFRQLRFTNARGMIEHMDRHGVDAAVVTSLHAAFYRDSHRGNEELIDEAGRFPRRLIPVPAINPKYAGWERDLDQVAREWKVKCVTLLPEYHGFRLTDEHGQAVLQQLAGYDLPVLLTQRLEDRRQRHAWDAAEDLTLETLHEVAPAYPSLRFVLSNWRGLDGSQLLAAGLRGRCLIDFARMHVLQRKEVPKLIETHGD